MKVTNLQGTEPNACKCGSWLQHWKNFSGQVLPTTCAEVSCSNKPEHGAHVQIDGSSDKSWYIVPLCAAHNNKKGETLEIANWVKLVSANKSETCEKK